MSLLLIKNTEIISEQQNLTYNIGIENSVITYIGPTNQAIPNGFSAALVIDADNKLAVPGMVNTHTHAAMTLLRSYADDMVLMDWLENKIWPAEANLTGDDVYWGTMLAIIEMLRSGTTTFADMYFFMDRVAEAVASSGIRASLARGLIGVAPDAQEKLQENIDLFKNFHDSADGRIRVMFGPHAPYTCPIDYLKSIINTAETLGAEIHMHLAETKGEVDTCYKEHGCSPIALMNDLGMFELGTLAAHCVHVNNQDIEIMRQKKVRVAHNPQSNLKLASGIAPVPEMLQKKILVALGTDGASSNNNLDMLEEARLAALLHKNNTGDPLIIPASEALTMVTLNGAKALGFNNVGEIKVGQKADIVLYDMQSPQWYPRHNRTSLFIYAANATDADTVIVNGKILMQNKMLLTIDEERVYKEASMRGLNL
ncbi:MAG TPA: amidohydrolase, partial [Candidatus Avacidaminococcus intestinavium]|nr:amidohydrolase [Candidatus Avacidaminococcus intestinavium]